MTDMRQRPKPQMSDQKYNKRAPPSLRHGVELTLDRKLLLAPVQKK
jgi:hypothetical protein